MAKGPIICFGIFHDRVLGPRTHFQEPEDFMKGKLYVFRPTRSSGFSHYRVMVKYPVVMLRRTMYLVPHKRQPRVPFCSLIGAYRVCPSLVVCCINIVHLLSLTCCFVSSGLKNAGWTPGV